MGNHIDTPVAWVSSTEVACTTPDFIEEAKKRGLVLEDRLDAQSAMYAVTKYDMSMECFAEWSEEDIAAQQYAKATPEFDPSGSLGKDEFGA